MNDLQAQRYLALLGVPARPPSLTALGELCAAQLARIPFENVSKLIQAGRGEPPVLPSIGLFLDRVEHAFLGGTCYACNAFFGALLTRLGYDVRYCGADMSRPDVHLVNVVSLAGRRWLVDVGYGAPFLGPMPLEDDDPVIIRRGLDRYRLYAATETSRPRLEHRHDGEVVHGYTLNPRARRLEEFASMVAASFRPEAPFLNRLRIVRHGAERTVAVRDLTVQVITGKHVRQRDLPDRDALLTVVEVLLQIPRDFLAEALAALPPEQRRSS
jgi:arylamine N-acetyltransferase